MGSEMCIRDRMEREVRSRVEMLEYMVAKDARATRQHPFTHRDVGQLVAFYYKDPKRALEEARAELPKLKSAAPPGAPKAAVAAR